MNKDKNLKEFNRLLVISLIFSIIMVVACIKLSFSQDLKINYLYFPGLPILAMGLMIFLNREYKKDFKKQLEEEDEEFIIQL